MRSVTCTTRAYALSRASLRATKSSWLLSRLLSSQEVDAVYVPFVVPMAGLSTFIRPARALCGFSELLVTMTQKQSVFDLSDEQSTSACLVGVAPEGLGYMLVLQWEGNALVDGAVLLIGGGVGSSTALGVEELGVWSLAIFGIDISSSAVIAKSFDLTAESKTFDGSLDLPGTEIVIDAIVHWLKVGCALVVDPGWLDPRSVGSASSTLQEEYLFCRGQLSVTSASKKSVSCLKGVQYICWFISATCRKVCLGRCRANGRQRQRQKCPRHPDAGDILFPND